VAVGTTRIGLRSGDPAPAAEVRARPAAYVAEVTNKLTRPHRAHGPLAATMLVVALLAVGCGASEPTEVAHVLTQIRSVGFLPDGDDGDSPFDTRRRTIGNLEPDLLDAIQAAARDAQADGVRMVVTSGWRSRAHQQRLLTEAISKYGSEEAALHWVSTPDTSAHVTGDAVDIGPTEADDWLSQHGSDYGLCQIFANEIWHFELATTAGGRCPDMLPDSTYRR
jgi:D-alanyl-D-alanine carboxypeptidase